MSNQRPKNISTNESIHGSKTVRLVLNVISGFMYCTPITEFTLFLHRHLNKIVFQINKH